MKRSTETAMTEKASATPPTALSITAICLWPWCLLGVKIVTCGVSIVPEMSLQDNVEKDRHKFPDALPEHKRKKERMHQEPDF